VRCNSLHPGAIDSPMTDAISTMANVSREDFLEQFRANQAIPVVMTPRDTSAAVVWLLSDEAAHVTGLEMTVDSGETKK
jgi:NAD(P)-dependent dehydrogenase (short-subunit alcohol dehydrogenase family)